MIQVSNLTKSFGDETILKSINLVVNPGETFAIIGRSGSGKSVLMRHMVGLLEPDAGRVAVGRTDLACLSRAELKTMRQRFGMLFQGGALFDSMTAAQNVAFPLRMLSSLSEEAIRERVHRQLELVELEDIGHKKPAELSGGQRKRVAIARAIVREPEYLFCDEPNSGLDPETSALIDDLLRRLTRELEVTTVVVTHDMHSVLEIADRVGFLSNHRMRFVGTTGALKASTDKVLRQFVEAGAYQVNSSESESKTVLL